MAGGDGNLKISFNNYMAWIFLLQLTEKNYLFNPLFVLYAEHGCYWKQTLFEIYIAKASYPVFN